MTVSRPWLALTALLFCLPLFIGLGRADLQNDEAIYSFSVDRMVEAGDWLTPKSSPNEDWAFLEKPPLKFWIVAAPIRWHVLPHNEFGLRFWDALFGSVAFIYVFLLGSMMAGPICGAVAVLVLFTYSPLVFDHGLRSNNMDAALMLSYCAGVYHYLRWAAGGPSGRHRIHAVATGLYFVLGFMTKFVAAFFLPLILAAATILAPTVRKKAWREWPFWTSVAAMIGVLVVPWFVYATWKFGSFLWYMILQVHVYTRMTSYVDPAHVQPWSYYFTNVYRSLFYAGSVVMAGVGLGLLIAQTVVRRWFVGATVLLWFSLPLAIISLGTSKLHHYVYPFLPPIALAAGYAASLAVMLAPVPVTRFLSTSSVFASRRVPDVSAMFRRRAARMVLLSIAGAAVLIAIETLITGQFRLTIGNTTLLKSSGVMRPVTIAAICSVLAGEFRGAARVVVALVVAGLLPLPAYRETLGRLDEGPHPLRSARDCLLRVESQIRATAAGLYVDVPPEVMWHPTYYYFRRVRPWTRAPAMDATTIGRYLENENGARPILIWDKHYRDFVHTTAAVRSPAISPPMVAFNNEILLLLPGPYAVCSADAGAGETR